MQNKYFSEIPFVRAIACLLVVLVHVTAYTYNRELGFSYDTTLYLNQLARFGTPIFAVISAFLLFGGVKRKGFRLKDFLLSRTSKVILPFIFWTFIYLSIKWYHGSIIHFNLEGFIDYFMLGKGYYHLYFMVTVIQFYLVFPWIQMIRSKYKILVLFFISLPVNYYWLVTTDLVFNTEIIQILASSRSFLLNWISYFMFGATLAYFYHEIVTFTKKYKWLFVCLFVATIVGVFSEIRPDKLFSSSRPNNILYVPILILFLISIYDHIKKYRLLSKITNVVGTFSMGIYLVHPLVLLLINKVIPATFWENYIMIVFILTVIFSILLVKLISFLPKSNYILPVPVPKQKVSHILTEKKEALG